MKNCVFNEMKNINRKNGVKKSVTMSNCQPIKCRSNKLGTNLADFLTLINTLILFLRVKWN
jgi:hypothetical protein